MAIIMNRRCPCENKLAPEVTIDRQKGWTIERYMCGCVVARSRGGVLYTDVCERQIERCPTCRRQLWPHADCVCSAVK